MTTTVRITNRSHKMLREIADHDRRNMQSTLDVLIEEACQCRCIDPKSFVVEPDEDDPVSTAETS